MLDKWKSIVVSSAFAVLGVLEGVNWTQMTGDQHWAGWIITAIAVGNIVLRNIKDKDNKKDNE